MQRKPDFLEKVFALMHEKRLTYREACSELGRRGASARAENRRRTIGTGACRWWKKALPQ